MNKENLHFIVNWGKEKSKAWSGTNFSLFNALSQYYNMNDIALNNGSYFERAIKKIIPSIYDDFGLHTIKKNQRKINKQIENGKVFQFSEIIMNSKSVQTFIYQDLSASYVKYMAQNLPSVFHYSDFDSHTMSKISDRSQYQNLYYSTCSGIFTMGHWLKDHLIDNDGIDKSKVHHVGGGINLDKMLMRDESKSQNKILFVGRAFKRKGGYIVYKAFELLKKKLPNVELYVAGPSKNPIQNPINGYYYYGDLDRKQLSELFNKCDIFVMPSYFEAYGLVFIEALSYGLPCIGRNVYEMPYFINDEDTGLLLKEDNAYELADMMGNLLKNERIKSNVRNNRDFYLNEYSWETVAKKIYNIIQ